MSSLKALTANLAARNDQALRLLFVARPDLITPPVPDFAALAARACTRASLSRALDSLSLRELHVAQALVVLADRDQEHGVTTADLVEAIPGCPPELLRALLESLTTRALIYSNSGEIESADEHFTVSSLREVMGAHPAGLGRPYLELAATVPLAGARMVSVAAGLRAAGIKLPPASDPLAAARALQRWADSLDGLDALLAAAPPGSVEVLRHLSTHPVGTVPRAGRPIPQLQDRLTPVDSLLAYGLIVGITETSVEMPRAVGIALRNGAIIDDFRADPPAVNTDDGGTVSASIAANAALSAVTELLRNVAALASAVEKTPVSTLRSGGVGVRELRRLAAALQADEQLTTFLLELAVAANLITLDVDTSLWRLNSQTFADFSHLPRQEQWRILALAWCATDRLPALVGQQASASASRPAGTINALGPLACRPDAAALRQVAVAALTNLDRDFLQRTAATTTTTANATATAQAQSPGRRPALSATAIMDRAHWEQPRLARRLRKLLDGFLREAAWLGILGSAALSPFGTELISGDPEAAAATLASVLPVPVAHFLLQADLTAVAPGYLEPEITAQVMAIADAEGQGPASQYRISADSLRRAFNAGHTEATVLEFLTRHSATGVPQPVEYLIRDTAARYGSLRVGSATSFLIAQDPEALADFLALPSSSALQLRLLAPTVAISSADPAELSTALAAVGLHAAVETAKSSSHPATNRAATVTAAKRTEDDAVVHGPELKLDAVGAQLATLRSKPAWVPSGGETATALGLEALQRAIRLREQVCITLVDGAGNQERLVLVPLSVQGGRVRVFDPLRETERVVSIHRVMEVEPL